jgi:murein DD-endopeptidase MepM/ murein hydrolase activator NlpD
MTVAVHSASHMVVADSFARRWSRQWPLAATGLLVAHALAHALIQARLGGLAIVTFITAPPLIFGATAVTTAMAARDLFHGGWRRILSGRATFPLLALVASSFLSLLTYRVYPSSHDNWSATWCLSLPLNGDIAVLDGGRGLDTNSHAGTPSERYAYDVATIRGDALSGGDGTALADYDAYQQSVLAPVGGTVVSVVDDEPDRAPGQTPWQPWKWNRALGNRIVLRVDDTDHFLVLAHLQRGSISVRVGDSVAIGTIVGRVGNSGRSGTPRLHLHVQDGPDTARREGVPIPFCGYEVVDRGLAWDAAQSVSNGMPTGRDHPQVIRARRTE